MDHCDTVSNYRDAVLQYLKIDKYPVLKDFVIVDLHYKTIPANYASDSVANFDARLHDPLDKHSTQSNPFCLSYLVGNDKNFSFQMHTCFKDIRDSSFPLQCERIKLSRGIVDRLIGDPLTPPSATFEEELYRFIATLNFDTVRVAPLLGIDVVECTRLLPQYLDVWIFRYDLASLQKNTVGKDVFRFFGPPANDSLLPVRTVRGKLAPCTSRKTILSLNDDVGFPRADYTTHLVPEKFCLIPLAFNPLENPIVGR